MSNVMDLRWTSRVLVGCALVLSACASRTSSSVESPPAGSAGLFSKAEAYERYMGRWSRLVAPHLVTFAEVADGDAVLDVGSGTGVLAFTIRDATTSARITGIDRAADYVAFARRQNRDPRVRFEVGDAQQLPFPDATFDKTVSLLVVNFIPDPARAVREMARVTKPSGVVTAAVWDYTEGMEMQQVFWQEAMALDPTIKPVELGHMPLSRRGELAALWRREGLEDVQEVPIAIVLRFTSFADYWEPFLLGQGSAGSYVAKLPEDRRRALERRLRARLLGDGPDRPIELSARVWAVKGRTPAR